jgi:predicted NBD/HSP70 family sugar kinase
VKEGRVVSEPVHLGGGWVGFDFEAAFGKPTKVLNDAAMQALGSYEAGKMLFLGLGTGLTLGGSSNGGAFASEMPYRTDDMIAARSGRRGPSVT